MRVSRSHLSSGASQRGAVLVTAMLLLVVLTIIGVTVMQMSRMQERMAGNTRDVNLAFQAAEGGLRGAEAYIEALDVQPVPCTTAPCPVRVEGSIAGNIAMKPSAWWTANAENYAIPTMAGLKEAPQVVVEELGFVRTDGGVVMGQEEPDGRDFYQVTARSTGGSGLADVVLQTTYASRF